MVVNVRSGLSSVLCTRRKNNLDNARVVLAGINHKPLCPLDWFDLDGRLRSRPLRKGSQLLGTQPYPPGHSFQGNNIQPVHADRRQKRGGCLRGFLDAFLHRPSIPLVGTHFPVYVLTLASVIRPLVQLSGSSSRSRDWSPSLGPRNDRPSAQSGGSCSPLRHSPAGGRLLYRGRVVETLTTVTGTVVRRPTGSHRNYCP